MVTFGLALAVVAAAALAVQSIGVRLSAKTQSLTDIIAAVFAVNVVVLLPVTAVWYYPDYGLTPRAVAAFAVAGLLGSLLARAALLLGTDPVFTKIGFEAGTPALVGVTVRVLAAAAGFGLYLLWQRAGVGALDLSWPTRWTLAVGVANTAYLAALARAPVSVVAPVLGVSPLLVLVGSALVAGTDEQVTARLGVAVSVLVAGVVLVVRG